MKVIGIDPSLTGTGIAANSGWCTLIGRADITKLPLPQRIAAVDLLLNQILTETGTADLWLIEEPALSRTGGGAVERHALYWLLVRRLVSTEQRFVVVNPGLRAMYATGRGNGAKNAVIDAVARRLPMFETGGNDNLCDAAILCAMGCDWAGTPLAAMPATHRAALKKVGWPEPITNPITEPLPALAVSGVDRA